MVNAGHQCQTIQKTIAGYNRYCLPQLPMLGHLKMSWDLKKIHGEQSFDSYQTNRTHHASKKDQHHDKHTFFWGNKSCPGPKTTSHWCGPTDFFFQWLFHWMAGSVPVSPVSKRKNEPSVWMWTPWWGWEIAFHLNSNLSYHLSGVPLGSLT